MCAREQSREDTDAGEGEKEREERGKIKEEMMRMNMNGPFRTQVDRAKYRDRRHAGCVSETESEREREREKHREKRRATTWFFHSQFALRLPLFKEEKRERIECDPEANVEHLQHERMDRKSIKEGKLAVQTLICLYFLYSLPLSLNLSLRPLLPLCREYSFIHSPKLTGQSCSFH